MVNENNGNSHWIRNITILIIIILLLWQYVVPYMDSSIKTPSDYISETFFSANENKPYTVYVVDETIGLKTPMITSTGNGTYYFRLTYAHLYHLEIQHSLNANIFSNFTCLIDMRYTDENDTIHPVGDFYHLGQSTPGYVPLISHSIALNLFDINYNYHLMRVDFKFYNGNGILNPYITSGITIPMIFLVGYDYSMPGVIWN